MLCEALNKDGLDIVSIQQARGRFESLEYMGDLYMVAVDDVIAVLAEDPVDVSCEARVTIFSPGVRESIERIAHGSDETA
jgi:hypothetical protein